MKPLQRLIRLALALPALLLLAGSSQCLALMELMIVDQAKAKELGMAVRTSPAGPDALWVELEFKAQGELKSFSHVELDLQEPGGKTLLSASLKEKRPEPERVIAGFSMAKANLDQATLRVVIGADFQSFGYDLPLKKFIGQEPPAKPAGKTGKDSTARRVPKPTNKPTDKTAPPAATPK